MTHPSPYSCLGELGLFIAFPAILRDNLVRCVLLCPTPVAVRLQYCRRGREQAGANDGRRGDRSPLPYLCTFALDLSSVVLSSVTEMLIAHSMSRVDFEPTLFSR